MKAAKLSSTEQNTGIAEKTAQVVVEKTAQVVGEKTGDENAEKTDELPKKTDEKST